MNAVFFLLFSWGMVRARSHRQVLALALVGVTGAAVVAQPSITYAQGMIGAITNILNLINGSIHTALSGINSVRTAMSNLYQVVAFPTQLINQARAQVTGITNQFRNPMRSIFNINLTSATLPETQALESVMRNGQIGDFNTLTSNYHIVFGLPLSSTAASPQDQAMVDMDDALAKDNLKTLKEIDAAGQTMLSMADQIEDTTSTAAPGSAPFLTATAVATSIQNQALTQKMIAAELRQVAGRLGYQNFAHILNTARGTNTAFLFSMQSIPQLLRVGRGFKEDVTSAPNTTIVFKTQNEETANYFLQASALHRVPRRSVTLEGGKIFGYEKYQPTGRVVETEQLETRAADFHIKNLPKGQIELLMTDESEGTLHTLLHVRPPADVRIPGWTPKLLPRLRQSRLNSVGANLRFKNNELANRHGRRYTGGRA